MQCDSCNTIILFWWIREEWLHFCSKDCYKKWYYKVLSRKIPNEDVNDIVEKTFFSNCLECWESWHNDLYISHTIFSLIFITQWNSKPHICCKKCGNKHQIKAIMFSLVLWWWGFPWWLTTPFTIIQNIHLILKNEEINPNQAFKNHFKELITLKNIQNNI
jgi:hypothetical protein